MVSRLLIIANSHTGSSLSNGGRVGVRLSESLRNDRIAVFHRYYGRKALLDGETGTSSSWGPSLCALR